MPAPACTADATAGSPVEALCAAVRPAIERGRVLVSFSGGLDSSLVLSAATHVARAGGHADPIPVTWRFADAPAAQESGWQEAVVRELGLCEWLRVEAAPDDLDLVGPVARPVLERHGVLYPPNVFLHTPLLARAHGGTLLTGIGGDQVLGLWRWRRAAAVLGGSLAPTPQALAAVAHAYAPLALRTALELRGGDGDVPWLREPERRTTRLRLAGEIAAEPRTWPSRLRWQASRRQLTLGLGSLRLLAQDAGARIGHPLLEQGFLTALARAGGRHGAGTRAATVAKLLGELLPVALAGRRTKAIFDQVFWRAPARELIAGWVGEGVDPTLVDADALAHAWGAAQPPMRSASLLQQIWLSRQNIRDDL